MQVRNPSEEIKFDNVLKQISPYAACSSVVPFSSSQKTSVLHKQLTAH